ncbi:hypothetical protein [Bradyrhizobium sp. SSUT77]|uniref:hypothetical protein n=1 Tax=Bradyrhizobium sp. SSUT77 TaxID=3040603 RepID=UPI00244A7A04|nr:hypothetical protein [Bradyrhizobium sp. SSUT77]MDH2348158.1 hypothetical protein [Bradyrhizobium sp. SSUT77]
MESAVLKNASELKGSLHEKHRELILPLDAGTFAAVDAQLKPTPPRLPMPKWI